MKYCSYCLHGAVGSSAAIPDLYLLLFLLHTYAFATTSATDGLAVTPTRDAFAINLAKFAFGAISATDVLAATPTYF